MQTGMVQAAQSNIWRRASIIDPVTASHRPLACIVKLPTQVNVHKDPIPSVSKTHQEPKLKPFAYSCEAEDLDSLCKRAACLVVAQPADQPQWATGAGPITQPRPLRGQGGALSRVRLCPRLPVLPVSRVCLLSAAQAACCISHSKVGASVDYAGLLLALCAACIGSTLSECWEGC